MLVIPPTLAAWRQFVLWRAEPSPTRPGKTDKFPVSADGRIADAHEPANWLSADEALALLHAGVGQGVGFVFTDNDPFFFLDIDGGLQDGQWSAQAVQLCQQFAGCFVEVSHSGTGLHIIGSYTGERPEHGCKNREHDLELYSWGRYVALTGTGAQGDPACNATSALHNAINTLFPVTAATTPGEWSDHPREDWCGIEDDDDLLQRMLASRPSAGAIFGGKALVSDLWAGSTDAHGGDHSSADAALCAHLAFWTGADCERMDRLFRLSGLMREKWDRSAGQGRTYGQLTILKAAAGCERVYCTAQRDEQPSDAPSEPDAVTGLREGTQFLSVPGQIPHFKGCVYVRDLHRIFTPDGSLLRQDQFRAIYGGYLFCMDLVNDKSTRSAWEAFTESSGYVFPKAAGACFRPEEPPGAMIEEENNLLVNIYVPIETPQADGDPTPFLRHVANLLPEPGDQAILLAYMAAVVQYPGVKFQWAPLLQGMEGNGKTLLVSVLTQCVGRRYTHLPNANDISNKFNAWLLGKLFIGIEEIYVLDRQEAIEALKPLITNNRVEIQAKGSDQATADNRANFLLTSNHQDAIRKTQLDRRYCVFFTAQQQPGDLERCGMTGDYFPAIYDWLRGGGYAIVNRWLRRYAIPDALNPATSCQRAPETSTTASAIRASMGRIEQEILEAVDEGRPGFCGGWVSSLALDKLLRDIKAEKQLPPSRRRDVMQSLGYEWHPGLEQGRVNNAMMDVGGLAGKPKLYIRKGHLLCNLTVASEIVRHYIDAQAGSTVAGQAFGAAAGGVR